MVDNLSYWTQKYFSSYLISQNDYSKNTLISYRFTFKLLLRYLDETSTKKKKVTLTSINKDCIIGFLKWLENKRSNSSTTRNVRLAHIKSFYSYIKKDAPEFADHCERVLDIPFASVETRPPAYMSEDAVGHLLQSVDSTTREGVRHLAILSLLYDSGCRVQELIDLKVSDIQFDKGRRIYVHGKGDKYREIPIFPESEAVVRQYIAIYKREPCDLLFVNHRGEQLTRQGVRYILQKYAGILRKNYPDDYNKRVHPHLLRHSKATHMVNHGVNIYNVRDLLGHLSVETTQIYLTSNPEVTRKAIENAAAKTVPESTHFYTPDEKQALLEFLDSIV
jgi:site-specific recombinase XerD